MNDPIIERQSLMSRVCRRLFQHIKCIAKSSALLVVVFLPACASLMPSGGFRVAGLDSQGQMRVWYPRTIEYGYRSNDGRANASYGTYTAQKALKQGIYTDSEDPSLKDAYGGVGVRIWIAFEGTKLSNSFKIEPITDEAAYTSAAAGSR